MMYHFDEAIDRRGHNSAKWDRRFIGEGKDARTEHVEISYTYDINNPTYSRYEPIHKPAARTTGGAADE